VLPTRIEVRTEIAELAPCKTVATPGLSIDCLGGWSLFAILIPVLLDIVRTLVESAPTNRQLSWAPDIDNSIGSFVVVKRRLFDVVEIGKVDTFDL